VPARLQLALIALAVCAVAAVAGVALAQRGSTQPGLDLTGGWAGAIRPPGARVPAFALHDQDGRRVTAASLRGKPVVFAFVYSTCRDTCPAQVQTIRGALDEIHRNLPVVGVSVDPANDTPARAKAFLIEEFMRHRMAFLLGTRAQLQPVWRAFGIQPQSKALEHSAEIVLVDSHGRQRIGFPYAQLTQERLAHDLARLA
jgi:protein SCO1/2